MAMPPTGENVSVITEFSEITFDIVTGHSTVYCARAGETFRAGESVEIDPPVLFSTPNFRSEVGAILKVDQRSDPQRVLLSLFLNLHDDMEIGRHNPPSHRDYVEYPSKHLVWTGFQGWFPATRVRREAFVVAPWEVNDSKKDAHVSYGMTNAYCVMAKLNHEVQPARRPFRLIGNDKTSIPGCLHLIEFDCATQRYWTFRSTVALKIANLLSKPSLGTRTQETIHQDGVPKSLWDNFKKRTIPLERTHKNGMLTRRAIRKHQAVEMLTDKIPKHFYRFDTISRIEMLKGYFGSGIQAVCRIRRPKGPKYSDREGPGRPAFKLAHHPKNQDTVGAVIRLPTETVDKYYSKEPGVDVLYTPDKSQLTIRVRYKIERVDHPDVVAQLKNGAPDDDPQDPAPAVPSAGTPFEYDGARWLVISDMIDGEGEHLVVCEVEENYDNEELTERQRVDLALDLVQNAVLAYNTM